ncbi:MAG: 5-formyltetrahydrofolate cyclo-ligase [Atopobiaceae bacterium]|jgi:5-formyltetrahydrofolate cyclo-ligase|nr:5-formyltetrahydrofolate cyclo-ligase [Atopobiaceae bacterium]MCH4181300.1 5-formyltetrahydrofolate cyclo-ligase [Atopobiaceae bacterium]MCH4213774.1 5-formyltetrahydrofolate cyclo-ligase [Atopobiaceae bacterium]MCH4230692.1 5-formyltetrahydrofolate cyclo-ligase [Atopobiaceae bacterium]MCH4277285.1 5-formyltetrahydrofolate cyclo-ligase [Atopobiaceae bacterium]
MELGIPGEPSRAVAGVTVGEGSLCARKAQLRRRYRQLRSAIPPDDRALADEAIAARVVASPAFERADLLLTYLSFGAEVETRGIIERSWADGKTVAIPRCVVHTRLMTWHRIDTFDGLSKSSLGVEEPADDEATLVDPASDGLVALALVPGLAFDAHGFRLGYGGGFYDTFLAGFDGVSMGLCREVQLVDDLAALGVVDVHDLPVSLVVTD